MRQKISYSLAVLLFLVFTLGPILWCVLMSLTPESAMLSPHLLPKQLILTNYQALFKTGATQQVIITGLGNSFLISLLTLIIGLPVVIMTGYALARYQFAGKKLLETTLFLTIVIPVFTTVIPIYAVFRQMNLLDNLTWTAIIYISSFLPFNTWIVTNYLKDIPVELFQAAELDGFNEWQIFWQLAFPLMKPLIITTMLIMFIMAWKQYMIPMIFLTSYQHQVVTLMMSNFMTKDTIDYGMVATAGLISILPPALLALIFRRYLVGGLTNGALK